MNTGQFRNSYFIAIDISLSLNWSNIATLKKTQLILASKLNISLTLTRKSESVFWALWPVNPLVPFLSNSSCDGVRFVVSRSERGILLGSCLWNETSSFSFLVAVTLARRRDGGRIQLPLPCYVTWAYGKSDKHFCSKVNFEINRKDSRL